MGERRLHIDVTSFWDRKKPPVGITRVVIELARAVRELSGDHQAWRYDHRWRRMRKVAWEELDRPFRSAGPTRAGAVEAAGERLRQSRVGRGLRQAAAAILRGLDRLAFGRRYPRFGPDDIFVFADFTTETARIQTYRRMLNASPGRTIFYCHDLIPILFDQYVGRNTACRFETMLRTFLGARPRILCNSRTTLEDLRTYSRRNGLPVEDAIVIPPGCDLQQMPGNEPSPAGIERPYILYVSTIEVRKNHRLLLQAWEILAERMADPPILLFVGERGWLVDDLLAQIDSGTGAAAHIRIVERLSDDALRALYRGALFTVYPSWYEGWGMPVTESLALGKLCLASDRGALPEAGAGFAELLDPGDAALWADRIAYFLDHPHALAEREQAIGDAYRPFRWSDFRREAKEAFG